VTEQANPDPWRIIIEAMPDGAALVDAAAPGMPVVYVNPAFERLTGYRLEDLAGHNLALLQGEQRNQPGARRLRDAIEAGLETRALVQNVRKSGEAFWMEVHIVPLRDAGGRITHWVSLNRETEARGAASDPRTTGRFRLMAPGLLSREDALTGLAAREGFEEILDHRLALARREGRGVTIFVADVDDLGGYNDTFGRAAGDQLVKRVARAVGSCFRRASDVLARWEGGTFVALTEPADEDNVRSHAEAACARVRDLRIHHPRSRYGRYVTLSVGAASGVPAREGEPRQLLDQAFGALADAQASGDTARFRGPG
jgi:diguanylate cyclase (GGDEF)-like protein/PAS domain S-box-containing protein